jgi:folate-binding protein YgfZ
MNNNTMTEFPFGSIQIPFDLIEMNGGESADFLQRISSNDLSMMTSGSIHHTLFISDKGRIIDTVWVIHHGADMLLLVSEGTAGSTIEWLNRYIIMEEIVLTNVTDRSVVSIHSDPTKGPYRTDYFGYPVSFSIDERSTRRPSRSDDFERWRIMQGIPMIGHEINQEYNPLELNLWNWISFTKGCYIGQEVIARLDTYNKVQRTLCLFSSGSNVEEHTILCDTSGNECGKVTSTFSDGSNTVGLALLRASVARSGSLFHQKGSDKTITVEQVFRKV